MKKTAMILGALLMSVSAPALAEPYVQGDEIDSLLKYNFYRMDTDRDGYVSRAEYESFANGQFTRADHNTDGFLTINEMVGQRKSEWNDFHSNYETRTGAYYVGDKYYPYGKEAGATRTPNEPYKANRGKTDRSWRETTPGNKQ